MRIIVDGASLGYRTWFSTPISGFREEEDTEENAKELKEIFYQNFFQQLRKVVRKVDLIGGVTFSKVYICWDCKTSTLPRKNLFPGYKQSRVKERDKRDWLTPIYFIECLRKRLENIHLRYSIVLDNAEADDLVAVLCDYFKDEDKIIVTRDRDMFQLVNKNTKVLDPHTEKVIGEEEVEKEIGVPPCKIVDYKALVGDPSDNYPGVKGIGPKRGVQILTTDIVNVVDDVDIFKRIAKIPFEGVNFSEVIKNMDLLEEEDLPPDWKFLNWNNKITKKLEYIV